MCCSSFRSVPSFTPNRARPLTFGQEEYPPIMSGYGMGTTMVNYYRKKDEHDEFVPKVSAV